MKIRHRFVIVVWLLSSLAMAAEHPGVIRGLVVDESGVPVAAVQVSIDAMDGLPRLAPVRMAETDKNGHFSIDNLELGSYKVFAKKESAGYPDMSYAFYSNQIFTTATLIANSPAADVSLRVGPKAGTVWGLVTDSATNKPVATTFTLRRVDLPDEWVSIGQRSDYRILIPSSTKVSLEVSAPGYKVWQFPRDAGTAGGSLLDLAPGEQKRIDIRLQPEAGTN